MPQIIHLAQTDSTNTYLRQQLMAHPDLEEGSVVWADYQRAGRGQKGNSWESEEKANLLFTLLLCPDSIRARDQFIISQLVSLGMIDVLNSLHEGFSVKWPNDIYYHDKKAVGILIENDMAGQNLINSFIGIGLNVNQKKFVSDAPNPVSLFQILGKETEREPLLMQIIERILYYYQMACDGDYQTIQALYRQHMYRNKGFHTFCDAEGSFQAEIDDVALSGLLTLRTDKGIKKTYDFKEVQFVI